MLGFFTRRVDGFAVNVGLGVAIAVNVFLGLSLLGWLPAAISVKVHSYWVGFLVNTTFMLVAYVVACVRRPDARDLRGLTVWTPDSAAAKPGSR
jgi:Na+/proline symporter